MECIQMTEGARWTNPPPPPTHTYGGDEGQQRGRVCVCGKDTRAMWETKEAKRAADGQQSDSRPWRPRGESIGTDSERRRRRLTRGAASKRLVRRAGHFKVSQ